jgi:hypothetical protein
MNQEIKYMKDRGWKVARETANTVDFVRGEGDDRTQVNIWMADLDMVFEVRRLGERPKVGVYFDADDLVQEVSRAMAPWREKE